MKVVPHALYEKLVDQGMIDLEFPSQQKDIISQALSNLPTTLHDTGKSLLLQLTKTGEFKWDVNKEFKYKGIKYPGSDINQLVYNLILGSNKLHSLLGSDHQGGALEEESDLCLWIRFEDKFTLIEK